MNVGIDGFNLALEKGTGIATYGRNLSYCLSDLGHEVHMLYGKEEAPGKSALIQEVAFFDVPPNKSEGRIRRMRRTIGDGLRAGLTHRVRQARQVPLSGAVIYDQFLPNLPHFRHVWNAARLYDYAAMRFRLFGGITRVRIPAGIRIMHWTYPLPIKLLGAKNIYTLHDLVPLRLPFTTLDRKHDYLKLVRHLASSADHIVTVSETSKADIISLLEIPEEKITNTYQCVSIPEEYLSVPDGLLKDELAGTFQLDFRKYFLFYGSIEPKKNVARIVEAYLASNLDIPFVVVGAQAWQADRELGILKSPGAASRKIIYLDYVTFPQLVTFIRGALAVTFPSLYEGFGLPILEGMVCGTPVITSNLGSMREIAGDAGILVDPYNMRDIKDAMIAISSNNEMCQKAIARGKEMAKKFSVEAYKSRKNSL